MPRASAASRGIDLDQDQLDAGDTPGERKTRGTDTGAEIDHAIAGSCRRRRRQQHGVVAGAVAGFRLSQGNRPPRNASSVTAPRQSSARNSWARPASAEKLARLPIVVLMDQDPARQDAKRALDNAHILVQHQMMDMGAIEQCAHRRNQNDILVRTNSRTCRLSFVNRLCQAAAASRDGRLASGALAAFPRTFYCYNHG